MLNQHHLKPDNMKNNFLSVILISLLTNCSVVSNYLSVSFMISSKFAVGTDSNRYIFSPGLWRTGDTFYNPDTFVQSYLVCRNIDSIAYMNDSCITIYSRKNTYFLDLNKEVFYKKRYKIHHE